MNIIQRQLRRPLFSALLVMLIAGCASIGLATPKSISERLAYAYASHTAALQTIANTTNAKLLSSRDATAMLAIADQSRLLLDSARLAIDGGDLQSAEGRLVLATNVLRELQTYLTRTSAQRGSST